MRAFSRVLMFVASSLSSSVALPSFEASFESRFAALATSSDFLANSFRSAFLASQNRSATARRLAMGRKSDWTETSDPRV